jgi:hypothetical protein
MESQDLIFVPLVLATVEGIKRHVPTITGWKTLAIAATVCLLLVLGDRFLPAEYNVVRQLLTVFILAIGGNAYVSQLATKLGVNISPQQEPAGAFLTAEVPTRRDIKTLPPKGNPDESP